MGSFIIIKIAFKMSYNCLLVYGDIDLFDSTFGVVSIGVV
jgi:hypothetical protein